MFGSSGRKITHQSVPGVSTAVLTGDLCSKCQDLKTYYLGLLWFTLFVTGLVIDDNFRSSRGSFSFCMFWFLALFFALLFSSLSTSTTFAVPKTLFCCFLLLCLLFLVFQYWFLYMVRGVLAIPLLLLSAGHVVLVVRRSVILDTYSHSTSASEPDLCFFLAGHL